MKENRKMLLTEEEVKELLEGYCEFDIVAKREIENRDRNLLKHFQYSILALSGAHN